MASWQVILRIHKKAINYKLIILDVRDAVLNKDKILNIVISVIEVSKEEDLQYTLLHNNIFTDSNPVYNLILSAKLLSNQLILDNPFITKPSVQINSVAELDDS